MLINTINSKQQQLENGYFKIGSGEEWILVVGSCRTVPYLNYLNVWNKEHNRFTICMIDPFNFMFDLQDNRVDFEAKIKELETDERLLELFKKTDILIHEHYQNFGMFNMEESNPINIFKFGMKPKQKISIPAFNDVFILVHDIVAFDTEIRKMAIADYNVLGKLTDATLQEIDKVRSNNLAKFYANCNKTSIPIFSEIFEISNKLKRYFHTSNHVSKHYTLEMFDFINKQFLNLNLTSEFWNEISKEDMYDSHQTALSEYDYGIEWNEKIVPLRERL